MKISVADHAFFTGGGLTFWSKGEAIIFLERASNKLVGWGGDKKIFVEGNFPKSGKV